MRPTESSRKMYLRDGSKYRGTVILVILMPRSSGDVEPRTNGYKSSAEQIRRGTTPRSITHANAWHRGAQRRDRYQFFSRSSDPRTSRPVADVARRRITIWLAMTAARFARLRGRRARIELYGLICNARVRMRIPRERASAGRALREYRARMLIGRARQGFPQQARIRLRVRGKRARRDRPTSTDKLSTQLFIRRNDAYPACRCRLLKTELCRNEDEIAAGFRF